MKGMQGLVFALAALLLAFAALAAVAHDSRSGVWTAELVDDAKLNVSIFTGRKASSRNRDR